MPNSARDESSVVAYRAAVREALIRAHYPLGGYPDPFNPDEDQTPYDAMAEEVVAALGAAGMLQPMRECSICHRVQPLDVFGNPNAPDICEGCYRSVGVDVWEAGDDE